MTEHDDLEDDEDGDGDDLREDEFPEERWTREGDADEPATADCPRCGAEMLSDATSCPKCGDYVVAGNGPKLRVWMIIAFLLALWAALKWTGIF